MLINYLSFYDPFKISGGGGQLTERIVIEAGRLSGHTIRVYSHDNLPDDLDCDFWFLTDWLNEPNHPNPTAHSALKPFLQYISRSQRYITFDNAYVDICYSPYGAHLWQDQGNTIRSCTHHQCPWTQEFYRRIYQNSSLSLFVSPLHQEFISRFVTFPEALVIKIPISDGFMDRGATRDIDILSVGTLNEAKGTPEVIHTMRQYLKPLLIGPWRLSNVPPPFHRPRVPRSELPSLYARSKVFCHLPRWPEPSSLTVREAEASGCKLLTNTNVGCLTYNGEEVTADELWLILEERFR